MEKLELPLDRSGKVPRLDQCYLCEGWYLEANLQAVEVPDQGNGWVQKKACQKCFDAIMSTSRKGE